ncbi:aldo/keto reductase [Paenibacillus barcinonensis]|uniref:Aldo/keto reductase n=1 Tax=Paenibacillus barcinonensis TaxID=198119 RepID=A0A2V4VXR7_PAEBA|nr:aldo/keto reductase [Paenibacillus barcinonensis]PYE50169.1 aryl-alcohol dehydrogenase-like predicted oxidoreductase [Paenibacillus barcinonensis]QKS54872.1 aldo/keto reductase [Paenibacillus barcinonensis]
MYTNITSRIQLSRLILGTGDLVRMDHEDLLDRYVNAGGNTIDTARQYTQSEKRIGEWMEKRCNRDVIRILTKCAHPRDDASFISRVTPEAITEDLNDSLEALRTDYIDLLALHRDDPEQPVEPIIEELNKHLEAGSIRAFGASNWTHQRIQAANDYAAAAGLQGFQFSSVQLSLARALEPMWAGCVSAAKDTVEWHCGNQMPLLSWSAQAGGFFSGAFTPERTQDNLDMTRVYYTPDNWERLRRAQQLAAEKGVSATQVALAFVLHQRFPTSAIIGPRRPEELLQSFEAEKLHLTADEMAWINLEK